MEIWSPRQYIREGEMHGCCRASLETALSRAHDTQCRVHRLPAVVTLGHLAWHTGVAFDYLRRVVARTEAEPYRVFHIRKRGGGQRQICVPARPLSRVQRWLHTHILSRVPAHPCAFAYAPGTSVTACVRMHCLARWLVKIDVTGFFESITETQVYRVFHGLGYHPLISLEFSRICTRLDAAPPTRSRAIRRYPGIPDYACDQQGHLAQGAPSSPLLSNLAVSELDHQLAGLAADHGLVYTRYSDDLAFSTADDAFGRNAAQHLIHQVYQRLRAYGLQPNRAKTTVSPPGSRKVVLGLLVDTVVPRIPQERRREIRQHVHFISTLGPVEHAKARGFRSTLGLRLWIEGTLNWANTVEPSFVADMRQRLLDVEWPL